MMSLSTIQLRRLDTAPPELQTVSGAQPVGRAAMTTAYRQAAGAGGPMPVRAADSVDVRPLLLDLSQEQLGAFSALTEATQKTILDLHASGAVTSDTVAGALNLPLADARRERYTEMREAAYTDAERQELAEIETRKSQPFRDSAAVMRDMRREHEIRLNLPPTPEGTTGIPMPLNHPGVQIGRGTDIIAAQQLRELGVDIGREAGLDKRLRMKLDSGEIDMVADWSAALAAARPAKPSTAPVRTAATDAG